MSWGEIEGHDQVVDAFHRAVTAGRLASTYLFVGPSGVGKRTFARRLAQTLLCSRAAPGAFEPCGTCDSCMLVAAGSHPDLFEVGKPAGKSSIPVELFIGDQNHRSREGLCHDIALKPYLGGRRIAIIDDAEHLNAEGANCLLKTLEEPPPASVIILISASADQQLPTIRSRSQIIRFQPLAADAVSRLLLREGVVNTQAEADQLAARGQGSLERAKELADPDLWAFREAMLPRLAAPELDSVALAKTITAFVDEAGREAPPRRKRVKQVIGFAVDWYLAALRAECDLAAASDDPLRQAAQKLGAARLGDAAECVERCLAAIEHIDRNANQATVIEAWLDDLAKIYRGVGAGLA